ncbi:MAG: cytochrome c3 family protein [Opitutaceae bacterium]
MARFFQIPNFKRDEYQRPEQKWVCGLTCEGKGCIFGPGPDGRCHTTGECQPAKTGDRWACTRAETHGGACERGPLPNGECCHKIGPCQPVLSIRTRRGRWVWAALALTVGFLLVIFGNPSARSQWISPGPLSSAHALSNTKCSDCHATADATHVAKSGTFLLGVHNPLSENCLKCHNIGGQPLAPHGFDQATLASLHRAPRPQRSGSGRPVVLAFARLALPVTAATQECVTCHKEHHGKVGTLTGFTDQQCQVCHQTTFHSFSKGHPAFTNFPFRRRTRIIFDHAKHFSVHFVDKDFAALAPAECSVCHVPSPAGGHMLVKSFAQTCAACHEAQIEGEGQAADKGIAFFRVPGLDAATLAAQGHPVGDWPADADGKLTPFTRLLLAGDPAAASALKTLGGMDISDLRNVSGDQLAAAETLAWSIKSLLADLVTNGHEAMVSKLGRMSPGSDRSQLLAMTAQIPRDELLSAQAAWFPNLLVEVANHRAGIRPASKPAVTAAMTPPPTGPAAKSASAGDDLLDDPAPVTKSAGLAKPAPTPAAKAADDDLLGNDDSATAAKPAAKVAAPSFTPLKMKEPEEWAIAGGWYRSTGGFTLYYRAVGHADPFLTVWLTFAGQHFGDPAVPVAQPLFAALSDMKGPGLCAKCHSIDAAPRGDALLINWHSNQPPADEHPITKFSHAAHFSLLGMKGCETCHTLKSTDTPPVAYQGQFDPGRFASNFGNVARETCAQCHNSKVARQDCMLCHNYHTGEFAPKVVGRSLMAPSAKPPLRPR